MLRIGYQLLVKSTIFLVTATLLVYILNNIGLLKISNKSPLAEEQVNSDDHPQWPRHKSRNVLDYIKPDVDTALLKPWAFNHGCDESGLMWFFVTSAPANFRRRIAIRETWADVTAFNHSVFKTLHYGAEGSYRKAVDSRKRIQVTFLLGTTKNHSIQAGIDEESRISQDILQENFVDSYQNLTLKSLFMLKWATENTCVRKCK